MKLGVYCKIQLVSNTSLNSRMISTFKKDDLFIKLIFIVHLIVILIFFDSKVHVGGDDSDYIMAGLDFLKGDAFPSWHGILYPILLSPIIAAVGINIIVLKLFSVLISIFSFYIFYKAFKNRVENSVLYFSMAIVACNHTYALYASTTYSEPLFILFQSFTFYYCFKLIDSHDRKTERLVILLAISVFLLSLTRNVGNGALIAVVLFLLIERRFKIASLVFAIFIFLQGLLSIYKWQVWGITQAGFQGQLSRMGYKNFYNPTEGSEDTLGFVVRFWDNANVYLSKHLASMIGIGSNQSIKPILTVSFFILFIVILYRSFKRSKPVFFASIYVSILLLITFFTQQVHWQQERLILVYLPAVAVMLGFVIQESSEIKIKALARASALLLVVIPVVVLFKMLRADKNIWNTIANMNGRHYAGYADEWINYAEVSKWAGSQIPEDKNILCRKSGIAGVYGGRKFSGITNFPYKVPDSADVVLQRKDISYVILDRLPLPTVSRLLQFYLQKHPLGLKLIYSKGTNNPSYLFELVRQQPASDSEYLERIEAGKILYPNERYYYLLEADKRFSMQDFSNALAVYSHALKLKSANKKEENAIQHQRALAHAHLKDFDKAKAVIDKILTDNPNDKRAWALLAYIYNLRGLTAEARMAFNKSR